MAKTITEVGNSQSIIFDPALMDLTRVKLGDQVNVTVVPGSGAICAYAAAARPVERRNQLRYQEDS